MSYPWPEEWLQEHQKDTTCRGRAGRLSLGGGTEKLCENAAFGGGSALEQALSLCREPDGPYMYLDTLLEDQERVEELSHAENFSELYEGFSPFPSDGSARRRT